MPRTAMGARPGRWICLFGLLVSPVVAATPRGGEEFFRVEELTPQVALDGNEFYIPAYFGPTGMVGWVLGEHLVVREVEPPSPAAGVVRPSDVVFAAGGKPLGAEPLKTLGLAVGEAEKTGRLKIGLLRAGRKTDVTLKLPVLGAYAADWPRDCQKSRKVLLGACRYIDKIQNADGSFNSRTWVGYAMNGLALLAGEDPRYIENARRIAYYYAAHNNLDAAAGTVVWGWGYMGIFLAEYYLKTGDKAVLPLMAKVARTLAKSQQLSGTWGHGPNPNPGYVQGGSLNAAAGAAWVALLLFGECGVEVNQVALAKATRFFSRFTGRGTVPYGNHRPEFALSGNSKDALACIGFAIRGDRVAAETFARLVTDGYRSRCRGHTGGFLGFTVGNIAGLNNPHRPDYRRMLDYWTWLLDASRSWDGGFLLPRTIIDQIYTFRGPVLATGAVALVYAAPGRPLRIFGAPKGRRGQAAAMRRRDVELSLAKAAGATAGGNAVLAVTILTNLEKLCGHAEPRVAKLLAEARSDKYAGVFRAQKTYEKYKWLAPVWPEAGAAMEKLAGSPEAGVFGALAREEITRAADSHKWSHYCEALYARVGKWRTDERARYTMLRTAGLKGGNWPRLDAARELRQAGVIRDEFVKRWRGLVPVCGREKGGEGPTWRYFALERSAKPQAAGWAGVEFDDTAWQRGRGPTRRERGARQQYVRIGFETDTVDFAACRLYYTNPQRRAKAVVYLNGRPVAWLNEAAAEYRAVELKADALKLLRKGRNVLAVRSSGGELDIGLYAQAKGDRP